MWEGPLAWSLTFWRPEFCLCIPKDVPGEGIKLHSAGEERDLFRRLIDDNNEFTV